MNEFVETTETYMNKISSHSSFFDDFNTINDLCRVLKEELTAEMAISEEKCNDEESSSINESAQGYIVEENILDCNNDGINNSTSLDIALLCSSNINFDVIVARNNTTENRVIL